MVFIIVFDLSTCLVKLCVEYLHFDAQSKRMEAYGSIWVHADAYYVLIVLPLLLMLSLALAVDPFLSPSAEGSGLKKAINSKGPRKDQTRAI